MLNPQIQAILKGLKSTKGAYMRPEGKVSISSFFVVYRREEELYVCPAQRVMPFSLTPILIQGSVIQMSVDSIGGTVSKMPSEIDLGSGREAVLWRSEKFNEAQTQPNRKIVAVFEADTGAIYIV